MKELDNAIMERRSIYAIGKQTTVSNDRIRALVECALQYVPSSFNNQSARAAVVFGGEHTALWNITLEALRKVAPPESFQQTQEKIEAFAAGSGTVLYFDDETVTTSFAQKYPLYSENFPVWAQQSNGMLQYAVWCLLEAEGLGATLQHYNPLIDDAVQKRWSLPADWKLIAQMPFGAPLQPAENRTSLPIENRIKVFQSHE